MADEKPEADETLEHPERDGAPPIGGLPGPSAEIDREAEDEDET